MGIIPVLSPLLLAWMAVPLTAVAGRLRTDWAPKTAVFMAFLAFAATLWAWQIGGGAFQVPWAPSWNLNLAFTVDGLAALYTLLAAGIGVLILLYSHGYLPHHLSGEKHPGQQNERSVYFYVFSYSLWPL